MNFGELKTYLTTLINRKDVPNALAGQFINQSIDRLTRNLRTPFMERVAVYLSTSDQATVAIPSDFLEAINAYTDTGTLTQVAMGRFLQTTAGGPGTPTSYCKVAADLKLKPSLAANTNLSLHYYGWDTPLVTDTDTNNWSTSCVDAVVYGAAELAADFYEDDRLTRFAQKYIACVMEIKEQAEADAFAGPMAIAPSAYYNDDWS